MELLILRLGCLDCCQDKVAGIFTITQLLNSSRDGLSHDGVETVASTTVSDSEHRPITSTTVSDGEHRPIPKIVAGFLFSSVCEEVLLGNRESGFGATPSHHHNKFVCLGGGFAVHPLPNKPN